VKHLEHLLDRYPDLVSAASAVEAAYGLLEACYAAGHKVLVCGNGGSAADSEHIVGELMKGYFLKRPVPAELRGRLQTLFPAQGQYLADHLQGALPAISLVSQVSLVTAFANDVAADMVFAQQVYGYGVPGDVVLGLSTSGISANVLNALRVGRACSLRTIGLTGRLGSPAMAEVCDVLICVPWDRTPDVQERHEAVYHTLCAELEERFF
jgi:D-sedoheptulose 7-phosphate isomerase